MFDGSSIFKTPKLKKMRGFLRNKKHHSDFVMFHHRWPTSTANVRRAAHPFSTGDYFGDTKYVLVHNGHVGNSYALKDNHEKLGITYTSELEDGSFNDSESLLWDVALTLEGKQEKLEAYGGIAFVAAKVVGGEITHLYFAKNAGRPLNLHRQKEGLLLSSEGPGEEIDDNKLYTYNYQLNRLTSRYLRVPAYKPYTKDSNYEYTYYGVPKPVNNVCYSRSDDPYNLEGEEGIDYFWDSRGQRVYYADLYNDEDYDDYTEGGEEEMEADTSYQIPHRTAAQLNIEQNEQDWYLNEFIGVDDQDARPKDIYDHYMTQANGSFTEAYDQMDTDLDYFVAHAYTPKRALIIGLLEAAMRKLTNEDAYDTVEAVDENYFTPIPFVSQTFKQQALLIGASQEG